MTVIATRVVDAKTNEIPVAQKFLKLMDLRNTLVSFDALHTQTLTSKIIVERGGFYLMNVKENQKLLLDHIKLIFSDEKKLKKVESLVIFDEKSKNTRTFFFHEINKLEYEDDFINKKYYVKYLNGIDASSLYFVTNLKDINTISEGITNRWKIENDLHRNKDMLLDEDYIRFTDKNIVNNLSVLNNFVLSFANIAKQIYNINSLKDARKGVMIEPELIFGTIDYITKHKLELKVK